MNKSDINVGGKTAAVKISPGDKFGRLTVLKEAPRRHPWHRRWECLCECGAVCDLGISQLTTGHTRSCGCLRNEALKARNITHGGSRTPEYRCHSHMMSRCYCKTDKSYPNYGARGIVVHPAWHDFAVFLKDMGLKPEGGQLTIERKNNNGNYEPGNCVWETRTVQNNNRRNTLKYTIDGVTKTLAEWCREYSQNYIFVYLRIKRGKNIKDALTVQKRKR